MAGDGGNRRGGTFGEVGASGAEERDSSGISRSPLSSFTSLASSPDSFSSNRVSEPLGEANELGSLLGSIKGSVKGSGELEDRVLVSCSSGFSVL